MAFSIIKNFTGTPMKHLSLTVLYFNVIIGILTITSTSINAYDVLMDVDKYYESIIYALNLAFEATMLLSSCMAIIGIFQENSFLLVPFLMYSSISCIFYCITEFTNLLYSIADGSIQKISMDCHLSYSWETGFDIVVPRSIAYSIIHHLVVGLIAPWVMLLGIFIVLRYYTLMRGEYRVSLAHINFENSKSKHPVGSGSTSIY